MSELGQNRSRWEPRPSATAAGPSLPWRLGASSWLLLLLVGGGGLAWLGFAILATVGRRRSWWIVSAVYAVVAFLAWLPEGEGGRIIQGTVYLVAILHGLIVNQTWLLLLWGRRENGLTVFGNERSRKASAGPRQRAAAVPQEAENLLAGQGTDRADYLASSPAAQPKRQTRAQRRKAAARARARAAEAASSSPHSATTPATRAPATRTSAPTPVTAPESELVDVNTANQRTLAKLPGMDRALAKATVAERTRRGGFSSLEDFASTAGLQPHEIVRLRAAAFCSPRPRAARSFGRRVDF